MRILLLALDVDLSRNRGDSIHVLNLAKSLTNVGNAVNLVVAAAPSLTGIEGVSVSTVPRGGDTRVVRDLLRRGRTLRPDVVYERRFSPKISAAISALLGVPYVVEINGIPEEEAAMQDRPLRPGPFAGLKKRARNSLLRNASAVVTVTEGLRSAVVSLYDISPDRAHVIPNGVDPTLFRPRDRAAARNALGLKDGPLACFVGNLVRWHGLGTLIDAMEEAAIRFDVVAIGDGPQRDELVAQTHRAGVSHRVTFTGEVPHSQVPDFIAASDLCVAPATAERNLRIGWSALKLYEYLACGRPLVASAIPGVTELIERYRCGIAVPPGDPKALGDAIEKVLFDPSYQEGALRASNGVREGFSWDQTASKVTAILNRVVLSHGPVSNREIRT